MAQRYNFHMDRSDIITDVNSDECYFYSKPSECKEFILFKNYYDSKLYLRFDNLDGRPYEDIWNLFKADVAVSIGYSRKKRKYESEEFSNVFYHCFDTFGAGSCLIIDNELKEKYGYSNTFISAHCNDDELETMFGELDTHTLKDILVRTSMFTKEDVFTHYVSINDRQVHLGLKKY